MPREETEVLIARYIDEKTEQLRRKQFHEGFQDGLKMGRDWFRRREAAAARGEPFDEPWPGSEEAKRIKIEAIESSFPYRLKRHWVWPHLVILFLVCLVIDLVALGYGVVWLVKYAAGIEGSGTVFWMTTGSLILLGAYWLLNKFIRWWYG